MTGTQRLGGGMFVALCLAMGTVAAAGPGLSTKVLSAGGKTLVMMANPFEELTFDPARGGRCSSFRFRDNGEQIIGADPDRGMFLDHWARFTWPSGLRHLPYAYKVVEDGKARVGLQLWVTVPPMGGGKGDSTPQASAQIPTSPDLIGLVVKKTIWLNAQNDLIEVEQEFNNPTGESRSVAPYIQHGVEMNGNYFHDTWYLPSNQGVAVRMERGEEAGKDIGPDWVREPAAGWMAVRDRQTNRGLLFVFDYNYLDRLYTCGMTAEWFMQSVPVAPGKSFKTRYLVKPMTGFEDFVYGSEHLVADLRPSQIGDTVRVYHDLAAVSRELANLTVTFRAVGWKSKKTLGEQTLEVRKLGFDKVRQEFTFAPGTLADGVVIRVVVRGNGWEDHYEYYYAGDKAQHDRKFNPAATAGAGMAALSGAKGDAYALSPPRKVKHFDKPDFAKIARPSADHFKCLVVFGLFTQILNLDDALAGWQAAGGHPAEFTFVNCPPDGVEKFPSTYDELFSYHVVVLSDVNYKALGDISLEMLCDYVQQGGKLLVAGGPYALGNGEFEGTRFLEVLPVKLAGPFDLKWAGKGQSWDLVAAKAGAPLLAGLSFAQRPKVFWRHASTPNKDSDTVLTAGGQPVLILGRYGKGKVAVLTLSPTGEGQAGETPWWAWDGWFPLVRNIFTWLSE